MKLTIKLISMDPFQPAGFDANGVGSLVLPDGADLEQAVTALKLPDDVGEAYMTLLNESPVPIADRAGKRLEDGDEITVFPAIKGG